MEQDTSAAREYAEAARLLGNAATGVADTVQRMHLAFASRPFDLVGVAGKPAKLLHDGITEVVYTSIRAGLKAGGALTATAAEAAGASKLSGSLLDSPAGRAAAGMLTGALGELVQGPTAMTIRVDGAEVGVDAEALARAYPQASGHIVLFLHGLIETERWWYPRPDEQGPRADFGTRLAGDVGCTPVYLRYNTGRHISANGAELERLLTRLVAAWPVPVEQISIVGHSMGGLVARSAVHRGVQGEHPWTGKLTHVVCLGTPHGGAPLELGAHLLSWALRKVPETAPLGELLELRSDGIKDLRYGYLHDDEWADADPNALFHRPDRTQALVPEGTRQHFFTATIARSQDGLLARIFGDALVLPTSADDASQEAIRHWAGGLHHFDLLHHDDVYGRIRDWLATTGAVATLGRRPRVRLRWRRRAS